MKNATEYTILGVPVVKITKRVDSDGTNTYHSNRITLFNLFLFGAGYASQKESEHIHFNVGITKFEILWSFCIRKRWLL